MTDNTTQSWPPFNRRNNTMTDSPKPRTRISLQPIVVLLLAVIAVSYAVDVFTPKVVKYDRGNRSFLRFWDNGLVEMLSTSSSARASQGWIPLPSHSGKPIFTLPEESTTEPANTSDSSGTTP